MQEATSGILIELVQSGSRLQFSVALGQGAMARERAIDDVVDDYFTAADEAERLGFYGVWLGDHMVFPRAVDYSRSSYPGTLTGRLGTIDTNTVLFDPLTQLAALAGRTRHLKFGTGVLVLPYRHPLYLAKTVATLDALSSGRVILGVGVGWLREEFEILGARSYDRRGALSDEYIRILRHVWSQSAAVDFAGRFYRFSGFGFQPRPVQPRLPIWIGGASDAAVRRVARLGDGWHPSHIPPTLYAELLELLRARLAEQQRQIAEVALSLSIQLVLTSSIGGEELEYHPWPEASASFIGSPRQAINTLRRFAELGVSHVTLNVTLQERPGAAESRLEAMRIVAHEIMPHFD
jgi:probable F420-dependent oxidoreductase